MTTHAAEQKPGKLGEAAVEEAIAGCDAGHRMAGLEPDDFDRELARRQLRGEITVDEAVRLSIAHVQRAA